MDKIKNALCILFSDNYNNESNALSKGRTQASIPFGGRYRLIDFMLSSLVSSGIKNIGIVTKENYGSLVDHLGWGKDWDLNRKKGGLQILTPFTKAEYLNIRTRSKIDALISVRDYLEYMKNDYVIIGDTNIIAGIDFEKILIFHRDKKSDITVVASKYINKNSMKIQTNDEERIINASFFNSNEVLSTDKNETTYSSQNIYIVGRELLLKLLDKAYTFGWVDIERDFITRNLDKINVFCYKFDGFCAVVNTVNEYYQASMQLFNEKVRKEIFNTDNPVLTRVKNSSPTIYGFSSNVKNSFVADGCEIDGELENCIIFRDVTIKKGAKLKNCIIMQGSIIGENTFLDCIITDKNVVITNEKSLSGNLKLPVVVTKNAIV